MSFYLLTAGGILEYTSANVVPQEDCPYSHNDEREICVVDQYTGTCFVSFYLLVMKLYIFSVIPLYILVTVDSGPLLRGLRAGTKLVLNLVKLQQ